MKDDLSKLLRDWQPDVSAPGEFRRGVWARIETRAPSPGWLGLLFAAIARPRIAVTLAALAILAGGISGSMLGRDSRPDAYLRSVNPYAMAR